MFPVVDRAVDFMPEIRECDVALLVIESKVLCVLQWLIDPVAVVGTESALAFC